MIAVFSPVRVHLATLGRLWTKWLLTGGERHERFDEIREQQHHADEGRTMTFLPFPKGGPRDLRRLIYAAHYVISRTEPEKLGATKLNKILWYADLEHYRRKHRSITGGDSYVRLQRGPVPRGIEEALSILKKENKIVERKKLVHDYERREFIWLSEPDISMFSPEEIDLLNVFIEIITPMTAEQISEITHEDSLWTELSNGELMPIGAGAIIPRTATEKEISWAMSKLADG